MTRTIRLIALARISDPNKSEADDSIERQREKIEHYFKMTDDRATYVLVDIVPEVQSASDGDERPVLGRVLQRVYAGEADGIIVARLDRLSRECAHGHALLKELRKKKKGLICILDGLNSFFPDSSFEYVFGIKLLIAQQQKVEMCANMLEAKKRLSNQEGVHVTGKVRYGWKLGKVVRKDGWKKDKRALEPVAEELEVIRQANELKAQGVSEYGIAKKLASSGIRTRSGSVPDGTFVRTVLVKAAQEHEPTKKWIGR